MFYNLKINSLGVEIDIRENPTKFLASDIVQINISIAD